MRWMLLVLVAVSACGGQVVEFPRCGVEGTPCCESNACAAGLSCEFPSSLPGGWCFKPCSIVGAKCCAVSATVNTCLGAEGDRPLVCDHISDTCRRCGGQGAACCPSPAEPGYFCDAGNECVGGMCEPATRRGQLCYDCSGDGEPLTDCGGIGQPCCAGDACISGICVNGVCKACGTLGKLCCGGGLCSGTTSDGRAVVCSVSGVCMGCGELSTPCCTCGPACADSRLHCTQGTSGQICTPIYGL